MKNASIAIGMSALATLANAISLVQPRGDPSVLEFGLKRSSPLSAEVINRRAQNNLPLQNLLVCEIKLQFKT
jgi:hypothetical protein